MIFSLKASKSYADNDKDGYKTTLLMIKCSRGSNT